MGNTSVVTGPPGHQRRYLSWACGLLATASWCSAFGGCSSDSTREALQLAKLTEDCTLNSDCTPPLVCAFERCHTECAETRDCPRGQRCVMADQGDNVCQLPDESECAASFDCAGEQVCADDGECRDGCDEDADCVKNQGCARSKVCAEFDELDAQGRLVGSSNSGGSGAGGSGGAGGSSGGSGSGGSGGGSGSGGSGATSFGGAGGSGSGGSGNGGTAGGATGGTGSGGTSGSAGAGSSDCPTGTGECDDDPSTVCEADLTLVTRCGACDNSCNGANGSVACEAGKCVVTSCAADFANCNDDASTGCETSLLSDEACGQCDRDCTSIASTCVSDNFGTRCDEVLANTYPGTLGGLRNSFASGFGKVFYMATTQEPLRRIPLDGSQGVFWSDTGNKAYGSLLVHGTDVIWAVDGTPPAVLKKPHDAETNENPELLFTPEALPYFLHVRDNAFYWVTPDTLAQDVSYIYTRSVDAPSDNPGVAIVTENQGASGSQLGVLAFTSSSDALYWFTTREGNNEIRTTPLSGGTPVVVPTGPIADTMGLNFVCLRTVGNTLYFNRAIGTSVANGIYRWTPGDTSPTQLIIANYVRDFVVDGDFIYYNTANGQSTYGDVLKAPLAGGSGETVFHFNEITSHGRLVYQDATTMAVAIQPSPNIEIYRFAK